MKNIRLLTKLLGGFITVSLIVLAVGLVGLIGARGLNASVVDLGRNRLTAVKSLDQIAIQQSRIESYEHSFMDKGLDQGAAQENFKKINDSRKAIDDSVKVYELLPKSKDEQDLWNQLKPALDSWWRADRDFITLVQAFQQSLQNAFSNSSDDSYAAMSNQIFENRTTFGTSNDILQKLLRVNDQQASMAVRHAAATGQLVELICAAGMGAGVLLALILGALLALSIARPLAKGVAFAEVVARGDFTRTLDLDRKDEVGKLAEALNTMAAKLGGVVATIQESAEQVASASQQITSSAVNLAEGAQSQASTLEETSASVEELTSTLNSRRRPLSKDPAPWRRCTDPLRRFQEVSGRLPALPGNQSRKRLKGEEPSSRSWKESTSSLPARKRSGES